jgi:molybdopterin molybdotransferase
MISVADALAIILERTQPLPPLRVDVGPPALGLVLAEEIICDFDSPPFDKAMMDGYAVRTSDTGERRAIEEVLAGQTPRKEVGPGQATGIMTGAPMPAGADAVVMVERTELLPDGRLKVNDDVAAGKNVLPRGREMKVGDKVFAPGMRLRPEEVGVLAGMGKSQVKAHPRPTVGVVPTGDEVVEVWEKPGPGQIRNSNGRMLLAQVARAGGVPRGIGIARDNEPHLRQLIGEALEGDVVVLSGGVSAGKVDLVPGVLASMGVEALVHKVRMKPGKPLYFGVKPRDDKPTALVFGLPGNPVSSFVCFELFVRPALRKLMGLPPALRWLKATLTADATYKTDRPTYHPAWLEITDSGLTVRPVPWFGSPDLRGVTGGNALVLFDEGDGVHRAGDVLATLVLDEIR